jgi:hypothetical protein
MMARQFSIVIYFKSVINRLDSWTLFVLVISSILYYFLFDFLRWNQYDSVSYEAGARLLFGLDGGADFQGRLSKPLVLILPGLCEFVFGIQSKYVFVIQSGCCYILMIFMWQGILRNLEFSENMQKIGTLMLITSQPIAAFSFGVLTDFPGWCCMLWLFYAYTHKDKKRKWLEISLITLIGLLVKESILVGVVFIATCTALDQSVSGKKKLIYFLYIIIIFVLSQVVIIWMDFGGLIKRQNEIMRFGWLFEQHKYSDILQFWRAFDGSWWFFLFSIISLKQRIINLPYFKESLISLLVCITLLPIIHPASMVDRIIFMFFPMVFVVSLYYLQKLPYRICSVLVVVNGLLSILTTFLIYRFNINGAFVISFILSLSFPIVLFIREMNIQKNIRNRPDF